MDQEINNLSSENQEKKPVDNREIMWSIRIFALIVIAVVVVSDLMDAWASQTPQVVVMTMSLLILAWSFRPLLGQNKKLKKWSIVGLAGMIIAGIALFFFLAR